MYDRIITAAKSAVWVITKTKLDAIWEFLDAAGQGVHTDGRTWEIMAAAQRDRAKVRTQSAVGVIPIIGTISQRVSLLDEASGGVSTEDISKAFDQFQSMSEVGTIVAEIDSPGGTYPGIPELADKIKAARGGKRLIAAINADAGSGALWLASAFDEVTITPSGAAGSVGAYVVHTDESMINETLGVKRTYVSYGKYKTEGNRDEPLSDETVSYLQKEVNRVGEEFETALARNRGLQIRSVQANFGQGRMLSAEQALAVKMVDRIEPFSQTIAAAAAGKPARGKRVEMARRRLMLENSA